MQHLWSALLWQMDYSAKAPMYAREEVIGLLDDINWFQFATLFKQLKEDVLLYCVNDLDIIRKAILYKVPEFEQAIKN